MVVLSFIFFSSLQTSNFFSSGCFSRCFFFPFATLCCQVQIYIIKIAHYNDANLLETFEVCYKKVFHIFFPLINFTYIFSTFSGKNTSVALCKKHNKWRKITTMWGVEMENFCIFIFFLLK